LLVRLYGVVHWYELVTGSISSDCEARSPRSQARKERRAIVSQYAAIADICCYFSAIAAAAAGGSDSWSKIPKKPGKKGKKGTKLDASSLGFTSSSKFDADVLGEDDE
jgi:hypothetical protein